MLNIKIDKENKIAIFSPDDKLSKADFKNATNVIDSYIEQYGKLNGLIISTDFFPGSPLGSLAEHLASHFISAKILSFKYSELDLAKSWIIESDDK